MTYIGSVSLVMPKMLLKDVTLYFLCNLKAARMFFTLEKNRNRCSKRKYKHLPCKCKQLLQNVTKVNTVKVIVKIRPATMTYHAFQ